MANSLSLYSNNQDKWPNIFNNNNSYNKIPKFKSLEENMNNIIK